MCSQVKYMTRRRLPTWKEKDEHLKIKVERAPCGRLMLRHRSNYWNVVLGVRRIKQRVEPPSPRRDFYATVKWSNTMLTVNINKTLVLVSETHEFEKVISA